MTPKKYQFLARLYVICAQSCALFVHFVLCLTLADARRRESGLWRVGVGRGVVAWYESAVVGGERCVW
jgi:hypothetical protein